MLYIIRNAIGKDDGYVSSIRPISTATFDQQQQQFEDGVAIEEADKLLDDSLSNQNKSRNKSRNQQIEKENEDDVVSWDYTSVDNILENEDDLYYSSCEEEEDCEGEDEEEEEELEQHSSSSSPSSSDDDDLFSSNGPLKITNNIIKKKKKGGNKYKDYCFGCAWGGPRGVTIPGSKINQCLKLIENNYGTMKNRELARVVHCFYKKEIYEPSNRLGRTLPMWRTYEILKHIEDHSIEPRIFIGESIRSLSKMYSAYKTMVFKDCKLKNGHSRKAGIERNVRTLLSLNKRMGELYRMNPKAMNFYNNDCTINLEAAGKLINLNKNWTISS
jgi:hypothetical protein